MWLMLQLYWTQTFCDLKKGPLYRMLVLLSVPGPVASTAGRWGAGMFCGRVSMYLAVRELVSAQHLCNLGLNRCSTFSRSLTSQKHALSALSLIGDCPQWRKRHLCSRQSLSVLLTVKLTEHKNVALSCQHPTSFHRVVVCVRAQRALARVNAPCFRRWALSAVNPFEKQQTPVPKYRPVISGLQ